MSPMRPARPCRVPQCPHVQTDATPCPVHGAPQVMRWSTDRRTDIKRLRGRPNQERRQQLFARTPLCVACTTQGRVSAATVADHIIPLAGGGQDVAANLQGLCEAHHREKTQSESARGHARVR
jgi:5-methylcytosine-specific restriction protein A